MSDYDALIIGAGHNGLTCAAYLAMNGLRVKVIERRKVVGGAAVTEEFHPGFRNSVAAYTVSLLNSKVIDDLQRPRHGLPGHLPGGDGARAHRADVRVGGHAGPCVRRDRDVRGPR